MQMTMEFVMMRTTVLVHLTLAVFAMGLVPYTTVDALTSRKEPVIVTAVLQTRSVYAAETVRLTSMTMEFVMRMSPGRLSTVAKAPYGTPLR